MIAIKCGGEVLLFIKICSFIWKSVIKREEGREVRERERGVRETIIALSTWGKSAWAW